MVSRLVYREVGRPKNRKVGHEEAVRLRDGMSKTREIAFDTRSIEGNSFLRVTKGIRVRGNRYSSALVITTGAASGRLEGRVIFQTSRLTPLGKGVFFLKSRFSR